MTPSEITPDDRLQSRADRYHTVVDEYADAMRAGVEFPPLTVFKDDEAKCFWLVDGYHRFTAARDAKLAQIRVEVHKGNFRAARLYAMSVNASHGMQRTPDDKKRVVTMMLDDPEWSTWSQGKIAEACKVSQQYVSKILANRPDSQPVVSARQDNSTPIVKQSDNSAAARPSKPEGRDGRTINTAKIGKAKPAKPPEKVVRPDDSAPGLSPPVQLLREATVRLAEIGETARALADEAQGLAEDLLVGELRAFLELEVYNHRRRLMLEAIKGLSGNGLMLMGLTPAVPCPGCKAKGCSRCGMLGWHTAEDWRDYRRTNAGAEKRGEDPDKHTRYVGEVA